MNHFFAYIDRMRYIERWALMRNSVRENIQEHSHQVAVLAHALAVLRNEKFSGSYYVNSPINISPLIPVILTSSTLLCKSFARTPTSQ